MQSLEDLTKIAHVDRELIETRIHRLCDMRSADDLRGILDYAAEDIVYEARGHWMSFPFQGSVKGKAQVAKALMSIATQFENLGSTVRKIVIDGEQVAVWRTSRLRHRGTGKAANIEVADFLRFRDGLVVEFLEIADSTSLAQLDEF